MSVKNTFFATLFSAIISIALCMVYQMVYFKATMVDFSSFVQPIHIVAACLIAALLLAWGNFFALKYIKNKTTGQFIFNLLAGMLSFASIVGVFAAKLPPETIEFPELFPGLGVPMHFFPVLAHLAVLPLFTNKAS